MKSDNPSYDKGACPMRIPNGCLTWLILVFVVSGCAADLKVVRADPRINSKEYTTLVVGEFGNAVGDALPSRVQRDLSEAVIVHLDECYPGAFRKIARSGSGYAEELVIRGTITEYREGNRFLRLMVAGVGSAKFAVDVSFFDGRSGQQLMLARGDWVLRVGGVAGAIVGMDEVVRSAGARIADTIAEKRGATKKDTQACSAYAI